MVAWARCSCRRDARNFCPAATNSEAESRSDCCHASAASAPAPKMDRINRARFFITHNLSESLEIDKLSRHVSPVNSNAKPRMLTGRYEAGHGTHSPMGRGTLETAARERGRRRCRTYNGSVSEGG